MSKNPSLSYHFSILSAFHPCISYRHSAGLNIKFDSIPAGVNSNITFTYADGTPTNGEASVDSGTWRPVEINAAHRLVYSDSLNFPAIGKHQIAIRLFSAQGSTEEIFDFWVEKVPSYYYIEANTK